MCLHRHLGSLDTDANDDRLVVPVSILDAELMQSVDIRVFAVSPRDDR